ncbi:Nramp family divalent metal transporter [Nakamurella sp. GG22]
MTDTSRRPRRLARRFGLLGPAFVAAVAYVDPGNVATNLQAGSRYGYLLVWVLVVAIASAGVVQFLSAKLGLASGLSLPELVGRRLGRTSRLGYWLQAEAVAMATDLAEVVGGAIALYLLFDVPLLIGGLIAGVVSLLVLAVQSSRGQRSFERVITGFLIIIAVGFLAGLFVAPPAVGEAAAGLVPRFAGMDSVVLAAAMLGATVMPHAVYLHSALTRDRFGRIEPGTRRRQLITATKTDVVLAMLLAGSVNIAMLLTAAAGLRDREGIDTIEGAHAAISETMGTVVGTLFAVGLLASGLASTSVGSYAGSVVMEGLLHRRIPLLIRRAITLVPALVVLALGADPTAVLVISQVVLSFGLPFVLIPLMRLTSDRAVMGADANRRMVKLVGGAIICAIIVLNAVLVIGVIGQL